MFKFALHDGVFLAFMLWNYASIAFLPKYIGNRTVLGVTVLIVGAAFAALLSWSAISPNAMPWTISINTTFVIIAALMALVHSETIFRRKNGYWRLVGPPRV